MSWSNYLGHSFILDRSLYRQYSAYTNITFETLKETEKFIYLTCKICNLSCKYCVYNNMHYTINIYYGNKLLSCNEQIIKNILE